MEIRRSECLRDPVFNELGQVANSMVIVSSFITLCMVVSMILTCYYGFKRRAAKKANPEHLSSDEEDDKKFLFTLHNPYASVGRGRQEEPENPLEALRMNRNMNMLEQIRVMFE